MATKTSFNFLCIVTKNTARVRHRHANARRKIERSFYCGGRAKLAEQQDRIAELMSELGLERGIRGSKAKHKTIQQFYSEIQKNDRDTTVQAVTAAELKQKKNRLFHKETDDAVAQRINNRLSPYKSS